VFVSPYETHNFEFANFLMLHGDAVKDVAYSVEDLDAIVERARKNGAKVLKEIWEEKDSNGTVRFATLQTVS
jgi:4-hydroxyphenylpyruvate dioxygenase